MKKKLGLLSLLLIFAMVLCSMVAMQIGATGEADATMTEVAGGAAVEAGDVVSISSAEELTLLAKYVHEGGLTEGVIFRQICDIVCVNAATTQSTMREIGTAANPFKGTYDGAGHIISNIRMTPLDALSVTGTVRGLQSYRAPFAYLDGATVENLSVQLLAINGGKEYYGGIAASAKNSTIRNCSVSLDANAPVQAGVLATNNGNGYVGGVVGYAENSLIDACTVSVPVTGSANVGGIVGYAVNGTVVRNCSSTAKIETKATGTKAIYYGGIAGALADVADGVAASVVENCYAGGKVTAYNIGGGIVGYVGAGSAVENCFADAAVATHASLGATGVKGGIAGQNNGSVAYVYCADTRTGRLENAVIIGTDMEGAAAESAGTVTGAYMYKVEESVDADENPVYTIVLGSIEVAVKDIPCPEVSNNCPWLESNGESTHQECGSDGVYEGYTVYEFVALEGDTSITIGEKTDITALDEALNAWISEFRADAEEAYVSWIAVGGTIINCTHNTFVYKPYEGQAATCTDTGMGDKHCALCDELLETNAIIPATGHKWDPRGATCVSAQKCLTCGVDNPDVPATGKHTRPAGVPACAEGVLCLVCESVMEPAESHTRPDDAFDCLPTTCVECEMALDKIAEHTPVASYTCKDTTCAVCESVIPATTSHRFADGAHLCQTNVCLDCEDTIAPLEQHTRPEGSFPCEIVICTVCGEEDGARSVHAAGMAATCTTDQLCRNCGAVIQPALGHSYDEKQVQTCVSGINCIVCGVVKEVDGVVYGPLGLDYCIGNRPAPTCIDSVNCVNCGRRMVKALGHTPGEAASCGKGQACTVCNTIIASATGGHTLDWTTVNTIREASPEQPGIVLVKCSVCNKECEYSVAYNLYSDDGLADVSGGKLAFGTTLEVTIRKVKDYEEHALSADYTFLQVVDLALKYSDVYVQPNGTVTVTLALNKTAAKVDAEDLLLYYIADDGTAEAVEIKAAANGTITFDTTHFSVYAIAVTNDVADELLNRNEPSAPSTPSTPSTGENNTNGDAADDTTDDTQNEKDGLSIGAIVGIVIGAVVVVAAIVVVSMILLKKKKGGATGEEADNDEEN